MSISIGGTPHGRGPGHMLHSMGSGEDRTKISGRVLLRLTTFVLPYWRQLVLALVLMFASSGAGLLAPYLTKVAIDTNIGSSDMHGLVATAGMLAAALAVSYLASAAQTYVLTWVGQNVLATLRGRLFTHLQDLSVAYHDNHIVGVTLSRVINDVDVINDLLSGGLVRILSDVVLLVGIVGVMIAMDARLALLTFSILPIMIAATVIFSRHARVAYRETRLRIGEVVGDLAGNLDGMRVIQAFAQEQTTQDKFEVVNRANRDAQISAMSLSFAFMPIVDILSLIHI